MPSIKTLVFSLIVIALSFSLIGCGLLASFTSTSDEVVEVGGQVPRWLSLTHRSIASEDSDMSDDVVAIEEEDDEDVDEDDSVTTDPGQTEQATSEVAKAAESGSSGSTQQKSSNQQQPSSSGDPVSDIVAKIVPGNREYNRYLQDREQGETPEQWVERKLKEQKEAAEEEKNAGHWFDDKESPSGFGN